MQVHEDFLRHPELPSAPLRAFSYTMSGGAASCGQRPNAIFKCPDGYVGDYPSRLPRQGGYAGLDQRARPASIHALTTACVSSQHTCAHYGARSSPHRYADFTNVQCNPFSNKIVLMDEVRTPGTARPACMCSPRRLGLPTGAQSGAPVRRHSA
jgi:hypothetical protein